MPCRAANVAKDWRVRSLAPLMEPELANPAASLSRQACAAQRLEVASAKTWKAPEAAAPSRTGLGEADGVAVAGVVGDGDDGGVRYAPRKAPGGLPQWVASFSKAQTFR